MSPVKFLTRLAAPWAFLAVGFAGSTLTQIAAAASSSSGPKATVVSHSLTVSHCQTEMIPQFVTEVKLKIPQIVREMKLKCVEILSLGIRLVAMRQKIEEAELLVKNQTTDTKIAICNFDSDFVEELLKTFTKTFPTAKAKESQLGLIKTSDLPRYELEVKELREDLEERVRCFFEVEDDHASHYHEVRESCRKNLSLSQSDGEKTVPCNDRISGITQIQRLLKKVRGACGISDKVTDSASGDAPENESRTVSVSRQPKLSQLLELIPVIELLPRAGNDTEVSESDRTKLYELLGFLQHVANFVCPLVGVESDLLLQPESSETESVSDKKQQGQAKVQFKIASFNLLHRKNTKGLNTNHFPKWRKEDDLKDFIEPKDSADQRLKLAADEIFEYGPDIVCLQEVDPAFLNPNTFPRLHEHYEFVSALQLTPHLLDNGQYNTAIGFLRTKFRLCTKVKPEAAVDDVSQRIAVCALLERIDPPGSSYDGNVTGTGRMYCVASVVFPEPDYSKLKGLTPEDKLKPGEKLDGENHFSESELEEMANYEASKNLASKVEETLDRLIGQFQEVGKGEDQTGQVSVPKIIGGDFKTSKYGKILLKKNVSDEIEFVDGRPEVLLKKTCSKSDYKTISRSGLYAWNSLRLGYFSLGEGCYIGQRIVVNLWSDELKNGQRQCCVRELAKGSGLDDGTYISRTDFNPWDRKYCNFEEGSENYGKVHVASTCALIGAKLEEISEAEMQAELVKRERLEFAELLKMSRLEFQKNEEMQKIIAVSVALSTGCDVFVKDYLTRENILSGNGAPGRLRALSIICHQQTGASSLISELTSSTLASFGSPSHSGVTVTAQVEPRLFTLDDMEQWNAQCDWCTNKMDKSDSIYAQTLFLHKFFINDWILKSFGCKFAEKKLDFVRRDPDHFKLVIHSYEHMIRSGTLRTEPVIKLPGGGLGHSHSDLVDPKSRLSDAKPSYPLNQTVVSIPSGEMLPSDHDASYPVTVPSLPRDVSKATHLTEPTPPVTTQPTLVTSTTTEPTTTKPATSTTPVTTKTSIASPPTTEPTSTKPATSLTKPVATKTTMAPPHPTILPSTKLSSSTPDGPVSTTIAASETHSESAGTAFLQEQVEVQDTSKPQESYQVNSAKESTTNSKTGFFSFFIQFLRTLLMACIKICCCGLFDCRSVQA